MFRRLRDDLTRAITFPTACRDLEQELMHLGKPNKKDFFLCFDAAVFALGHAVPLSFAPMLLPALERATFERGECSGALTNLSVFAHREVLSLIAWKRACEGIANGKRLRFRQDGRFGSQKAAAKATKTIASSVKIKPFKSLSDLKLKRENRKLALERIARVFEGGAEDLIVTDLVVNLTCPLGLKRIEVPGRTQACEHLGCFDVESFARLAETQRDYSLRCPECSGKRKWGVEQLLVDPVFEDILDGTAPEVIKARIFRDGSWEIPKKEKTEDIASESENDEIALATALMREAETGEARIEEPTRTRMVVDLT